MDQSLTDTLHSIRMSLGYMVPELILSASALLIIVLGLIFPARKQFFHLFALLTFVTTVTILAATVMDTPDARLLFNSTLRTDYFSDLLKILFDIAALLSVYMTIQNKSQERLPEYYALMISSVVGAHLLVMSENLLILFLSLELLSISAYLLTGFSFQKRSTEGSLKYFIFGSVASAVMIYGFSLLYGIAGTLQFTSSGFGQLISANASLLTLLACLFSIAGFLYKVAAAPMHPWAPDVYEAASMPIVAFFSVVPKLAGIGILTKFLFAISRSNYIDWQFVFALIILVTITIGNFSALGQKNVKRLMAYSSIAQSGFLLIGVLCLCDQGLQFLMFYATIYVLMNYLIFIYLQYFENFGFTTIADYQGSAKSFLIPSIFMLVGFISLTGLPPTAGFTGKLFLFTGLWDLYSITKKPGLLILLIFGLINTVVALFYYLRIPYYAFIRPTNSDFPRNNLTSLNLLGAVLVLVILISFFSPGLLMGWINKINFVF